MKKILLVCMLILSFSNTIFAGDVIIKAKELGRKLARDDCDLTIKLMEKTGTYKTNVFYMGEYQIIGVEVENNSESIVNVNPNYFTLVSNKKASYAYSSETHVFKDKLKYISISPIQAVDVYPGTITEGFLLFEKKYKKERPKKLFFKNLKTHIGVDVILDTIGRQ